MSDAKKLLEDIPNKTKHHLGILVDVNLKNKEKKQYIEIVIEVYPNPISYLGEYHYRSGSTKQVLRGSTLDKFLLQKQGKKWDSVPIDKIKFSNFDTLAFDNFRQKVKLSSRMTPEMLKVRNDLMLENLRLKAENNYFKRAAILLFHKKPGKYFSGAFIKIGYFNEKVLYLIKENSKVTIEELIDLTGKSKSTIQRVINKLKDDKKIRRAGSNKVGYWELLES